MGMSAETIASEWHVSLSTVRSHIRSILRKLDVRSRDDAVAAADRMRSSPPIKKAATC
jgi:DNA-binding NarL/FixJ family response regulator